MKDEQEFDQELARAMQRVDAPQTLEAFVLDAVARSSPSSRSSLRSQPKPRVLPMRQAPAWMTGAVAAVLVIGCAVGGGLHVRHGHAQAKATAEFELSERITDRALEQTRQQLQQAGVSLDQ